MLTLTPPAHIHTGYPARSLFALARCVPAPARCVPAPARSHPHPHARTRTRTLAPAPARLHPHPHACTCTCTLAPATARLRPHTCTCTGSTLNPCTPPHAHTKAPSPAGMLAHTSTSHPHQHARTRSGTVELAQHSQCPRGPSGNRSARRPARALSPRSAPACGGADKMRVRFGWFTVVGGGTGGLMIWLD